MKLLISISAQNDKHAAALKATGYWGKVGAGAILVARATGRILLLERSEHVQKPHTWGGAGGAVDDDETPLAAVKREGREELGYTGTVEYKKIAVFADGSFKYHNYFGFVDKEFKPTLNDEHSASKWFRFDQVYPAHAHDLHPGIEWLFREHGAKMLGVLEKNGLDTLKWCHGHVRKQAMRARCGGPPRPGYPGLGCYMCRIESEAQDRKLIP